MFLLGLYDPRRERKPLAKAEVRTGVRSSEPARRPSCFFKFNVETDFKLGHRRTYGLSQHCAWWAGKDGLGPAAESVCSVEKSFPH